MKNWVIILFLMITGLSIGQNTNNELGFAVIKETLPQVLNENPNSIASYVKGGKTYKILTKGYRYLTKEDNTIDTVQLRLELDVISDSITKILEKNKIIVLLSDTLFAYKYLPNYYDHGDGWIDTFDLRDSNTWQIKYEDLVEVFQTNYEFRGLTIPVDLKFTELIKTYINSNDFKDIPIDLNELNNSYYEYTSTLPANFDSLQRQGLFINGIRIYKPLFNKSLDKACYLFSFQARNGPWREFIFIEKRNGNWCFIDSYGSEHIDRNEYWLD